MFRNRGKSQQLKKSMKCAAIVGLALPPLGFGAGYYMYHQMKNSSDFRHRVYKYDERLVDVYYWANEKFGSGSAREEDYKKWGINRVGSFENLKILGPNRRNGVLALANGVTGSSTDRAPCIDLTGTWRNQLGSNMTVQRVGDTNKFTGRYNTSVESSAGDSKISSDISGQVQPVEGGSLVAFNVLWNHGASITAWVGQCLVCDGQEKLYTSWVLRSREIPKKRWMSTRINQDTFWRVDEESQDKARDATVNVQSSDILGDWKSVTGDSVEITQASEQGSMEGLHKGAGAKNGAPVFGRFDGNETCVALGFAAANEQYIRGWAGHIYNPQDGNQQMETSSLSHKFSGLCSDPRKHVEYGMDYYSKGGAKVE